MTLQVGHVYHGHEQQGKPDDEDQREHDETTDPPLAAPPVRHTSRMRPHLLRVSPTLDEVNIGVDVLHFEPVAQRERRVCKHPIQHASQLQQERYGLDSLEEYCVEDSVVFGQEVAEDVCGVATTHLVCGQHEVDAEDEVEDDDKINKIMGVAFSTYKKASEKLGVSGCYNCFQKHRAFDCPLKSCKFCKQPTSKVQHFSIICPNCPSRLDMYNKQRNDWKEKREQDKVKALWEENRVFDFGSEDESD